MFQMTHKCSNCDKVFTRKYNRDKHFKNQHTQKSFTIKRNFTCPFCQQNGIIKNFDKKEMLVQHVDHEHLKLLFYKLIKSAFNGKISVFSKQLVTLQPLEHFISDRKNLKEIMQVILHQLSKYEVVKVALIVTADYRIPSVEQDSSAAKLDDKNNDNSDSASADKNNDNSDPVLAEERDNFTLRTKREIFNVNESITTAKKKVKILLKSLLEREQDLLMRGSGWQFESLQSCNIEIVSHNTI